VGAVTAMVLAAIFLVVRVVRHIIKFYAHGREMFGRVRDVVDTGTQERKVRILFMRIYT